MQDLFGNMPVRVQQRPRTAENKRGEWDSLASLKRNLTGLIFAWGKPINLDLSSAFDITSPSLRFSAVVNLSEKPSLQNRLDLALVRRCLVQAGYLDPTTKESWIKVSARTFNVSVNGVISMEPAPNKAVQFLALGIEPLESHLHGGTFIDEINSLFALSNFGAPDRASNDDMSIVQGVDPPRKIRSHSTRGLTAHGKGPDRWPKFVIKVNLCDKAIPALHKTEESVVFSEISKVIRATIIGFLEDNSFKPRRRHLARRVRPTALKCSSSPTALSSATFQSWSRVKGSVGGDLADLRHWKAATDEALSSCDSMKTLASSVGIGQNIVSRSKSSQTEYQVGSNANEDSVNDANVAWYDSFTKAPVLINARTGFALPTKAQVKFMTHDSTQVSTDPGRTTWAAGFLEDWENPVFNPREGVISRVSYSDDLTRTMNQDPAKDMNDVNSNVLHDLNAKLSKANLKKAHVISQVDQKFILVHIDIETSRTTSGHNVGAERILVLIDQHAADERIRVESLLAELCTVQSTSTIHSQSRKKVLSILLAKPILFQITTQECALFRNSRNYFTQWGINYDVCEKSQKTSTTTANLSCYLSIKSLPSLVAERCRTQPKVLIDLLREEVWGSKPCRFAKPSGTSNSVEEPVHSSGAPPWLTMMHTMPRGLLDMLNSRACRSAIMFNDSLTLTECQALVHRLAETQFPFQCAHGRPSVVPLVGTGHVGTSHEEVDSVGEYGFIGNFGAGCGGREGRDVGFLESCRRSMRD